jgi:gliding motility-associated-like protein
MKVVTNALLVALFSLLAIGSSYGQDITMQDGVFYTCSEKFYDSGNVGGNYGNNENFTLTICPDNADARTSVTFNSFDSEGGVDRLTVYNSNGTAVPVDQYIDGDSPLPVTVTATNKTGCLTFVWSSDNGTIGQGWDADITCASCQQVVPLLASSVPAVNAANIIGICAGGTVSLSGDVDYPEAGNNYNQDFASTDFYWDMGNGSIVDNNTANSGSYTYTQPGVYYANLIIRDKAGCRNTSLLNQEIHVSAPATFNGTTPDQTICEGGFADLTAQTQQTRIFNNRIESNNTQYDIVDGAATCIESDLQVNFFASAATYSVGDINKVNISIYHGSIDDVVLILTAPDGTAIKLHNRGINPPNPNNTARLGNNPTFFDYSFNAAGSGNTWAQDNVIQTPSGSYKSVEPFTNFNGVPLNGTWTLSICDVNGNGVDGKLNTWGIDFNNANYSSQPSFVPGTLPYPSSRWLPGGENITTENAIAKTIRVEPTSPVATYTYRVTNEYNCVTDTTIDVTVEQQPTAGNDNSDNICGDGDYDLTTYLVGQDNSANNAFWEVDPNNPDFPTTFLAQSTPADALGKAAFNADGVDAGTYVFRYIQPGIACDNDTAFITMTVAKKPKTGGTNSITICSNEGDRLLFPILVGSNIDTTGTWFDVNTSGALADPNDFNTTFDVELAGPGVYNFDYTVNNPPCAPKTTRITITVNQEPNPGTDANTTVCNTANAYDLFETITDGDAGGEWFYNDGTVPGFQDVRFMSGVDFNILDPAGLKGLYGDGVYEFVYRVGDGSICEYAYATATITLSEVPAAGSDPIREYCTSNNTIFKLYNLNGADDGGDWTDNDGAAPAFNATDTTFQPSAVNIAPALYPVTYTFDHEQEAEGCPKDLATLTIIVHRQPNAGASASTAICEDEQDFDMFSELTGTPGAVGPSPQPENGTWVVRGRPDLSDAQYLITGPTGADYRFNAQLAITNGVLVLSNNCTTIIFDYTVTSTGGGCVDAKSSVTTKICPLLSAGTTTNFIVCSIDPNVNLFEAFAIPADQPDVTDGVWSDDGYNLTNPPFYSDWLSGVGFSTLSAQNAPDPVHQFRYTIARDGCPNQTSTVQVNIDKKPFAGVDSTVFFCTTATIVPLFDQLGTSGGAPDMGGTWTKDPGNPCTGACGFGGANFAPNQVDCDKTYNFTYTKTSQFGTCDPDNAVVSVNVVCNPNPGQAPAQPKPVCRTNCSTLLFDLLTGNPQIGGTWTDEDGTGALSSNLPGNHLATFNACLAPDIFGEPDEFQFKYTVDNGYCSPKSTTVTIRVYKNPYAGDDVAITTCETTTNINLYAQLGTSLGTPETGGTWTDLDGSQALGGSNFNPSLAVTSNGVDTYRFKYSVNLGVPALVGTACYSDEAIVTVTIVKTPEAGSDGEIYACIDDNDVPLFPVLEIGVPGGVDGGGTWTGPIGAISCLDQATGKLNATCVGTPGDYVFTYTAKNVPCPQDQADVTVHIEGIPSSGTNNTVTLCVTSQPYELINAVGGTPHTTGTFTAVPGCNECISAGGFFSPSVAGPGTYPVRYQAKNNTCTATTFSTLTVTVEELGNAGANGSIVVCQTNTSVPLTPLLGGSADIDPGVWTSVTTPSSTLFGGKFVNAVQQFVESQDNPRKYRYTVTPVACPVVKTEVTVTANRLPVAGTDGNGVACITNQVVALGSYITGEDAGGIWTANPPVSGLTDPTLDATAASVGVHRFEYTVSKEACPDDVSVAIIEVKPENYAGLDGETTKCASLANFNLNEVITDEDINGTWEALIAPVIALSDPNFSPAVAGVSPPGGFKLEYTANNGACPPDKSIATVHVKKVPQTGISGTVLICETDAAFDLGTILNETVDANGIWTDVDGSGGLTSASAGTFNPQSAANISGPGDYKLRYTINNGVCAPVFSTVTVKLRTLADAGVNATGYVCETDRDYDVAALINAAPGIGTWTKISGPNPNSAVAGRYFDATAANVPTGEYKFKYKVPANGCPADSAIATLKVVEEISLVKEFDNNAAGPEIKCNTVNGSYTVSFSVKGGAGGFIIDDNSNLNFSVSTSGTGLKTYTSASIFNGPIYEFGVTDSIACGIIEIKGYMVCTDTDGDGIADTEDLDDDNDGISDWLESGYYTGLIDTTIDITLNNNFDAFVDYKDPAYCPVGYFINNKGVCSFFDADGDGIINQFDLDSDGDKIYDAIEYLPKDALWAPLLLNGKLTITASNDLNRNGWYDQAESNTSVGGVDLPVNSDNDAGLNKKLKADYLDTDSDNDGIPDVIESDGAKTNPVDTDSDGVQDYRDTDSDDDTVQDVYEGMNGAVARDTDNDGVADFRDLDSDNDGISDRVERVTGITVAPVDTDEDGKYDFQDLDSDDDTMPDKVEAGDPLAAVFPANSDNDGISNYRDLDSDGDGVADIFEAGPDGNNPVNTDGLADGPDYLDLDSDDDGLYDELEGANYDLPNDPTVRDQTTRIFLTIYDTDGDGKFDFQDTDADNDGISDKIENSYGGGILSYAQGPDGDGIPNFRDLNSDQDCILDAVEAGDPNAAVFPADSDGDIYNKPNFLDPDSDNDGIDDCEEAGTDPNDPVDSDGDGLRDYMDPDSDNDGVSDKVEGNKDCDSDGNPNYTDFGDNCRILVDIPEGFSPNQDEINDRFVIPELEDYPNNTLKIYNRWGVLVYEKANYDNTWDGKAENPLYGEEELPVGTYFYLLDLGLDQEPIRGYVYLNR